jgi:homoserine kinase type II
MTASDPPAVSMLWERADPYAALDQRFAFAKPEDAAAWLGATVAGNWGIGLRRCERIVLSARNALAWLDTDAGKLLAKWSIGSGLHPRLVALAELTDWLHRRGLPVSAPIAALDGSLQLATPNGSLGLQAVMVGELLDPSDRAQVHEAGSVLAAFHAALAAYPRAGFVVSCSAVSSPYDPGLSTGAGVRAHVTRWLDSIAPASPTAAVAFLRDRLPCFPEASLPTPQLVHNDVRSANILCRGTRVSALLDFEEVTVDHRVSDLAKAAVLLGTRFHNWAPLDLAVQRCFVEGYREFGSLSSSEEASLPVLAVYRTLTEVPAGADPAGWATAAERLAAQADPFR